MSSDQNPLRVELLPAALEQKPVLADLFQLYARDFTAFHPVEFDADGRFHHRSLDAYWQDQRRFPFLVAVDGRIAGFALVQQGSQISGDSTVWDMAEFFVLRDVRRHGIGTTVARAVWTRFPGPWEVRVMQSNRDALLFWRAAVTEFAGRPIEPALVPQGSISWCVFLFESPASG